MIMSVKQPNEWIDRYVNEVGQRLPAKGRSDVEREIRSLIEDEVAGRLEMQADGATPKDTEVAVLAVLEQFGAPEQMAARYHAPRYLIGPALFPIFWLVLGIVLIVMLFVNLLGLAVAAGTGTVGPLIDTLLSLFVSLTQAAGMVTLIFALLEYLGVGAGSKPEAWQPRDLPPVKDPNRASRVEAATEIAFTAAVLTWANFYLNRGTGALFYNGEWQAIPLFTPEFLQYIPWLTVLWSADILVNTVLLVRGRWEPATRVAAMAVSAATAFLFYRMLVGGPIAAWAPLEPAFKITVAIIFAVSLWEIGKHGWHLLRNSGLASDRLRSQHVA